MCFDTTDVMSLELYIKAFIYLIVYIVSHFPGRRECQRSSTEENINMIFFEYGYLMSVLIASMRIC